MKSELQEQYNKLQSDHMAYIKYAAGEYSKLSHEVAKLKDENERLLKMCETCHTKEDVTYWKDQNEAALEALADIISRYPDIIAEGKRKYMAETKKSMNVLYASYAVSSDIGFGLEEYLSKKLK